MLFVCLVVKHNGFHSLEMHRAYLKCERQKEAEYLCSSGDFKLLLPNHYWVKYLKVRGRNFNPSSLPITASYSDVSRRRRYIKNIPCPHDTLVFCSLHWWRGGEDWHSLHGWRLTEIFITMILLSCNNIKEIAVKIIFIDFKTEIGTQCIVQGMAERQRELW